jgi:curved DNA-binding protein CbpA
MKAVYKAWAVNHHPDKGGDSETFKRINVAWDKIKEERGF